MTMVLHPTRKDGRKSATKPRETTQPAAATVPPAPAPDDNGAV
jgi:hypothetical protein